MIFDFMATLSDLKTDHCRNRLQVGQQHYRLIMIENLFDILSLKNWRIPRYIKIGSKSLLVIQRYKTFMTKVKRIAKSTKKTWTSSAILLQTTTGKCKTRNKIWQSNLVKLLRKKEWAWRSKKLNFLVVKPSAYVYFRRSKNEKWRSVYTRDSNGFTTKNSQVLQKGSKADLLNEDEFKLSRYVFKYRRKQLLVEYRKGDNIWYKKCPLPKNDVRKLFLKVAQNNGLQGRLADHSDCKGF